MKQRKPFTPETARIYAEELCARAEHSSGEIRDKLIRHGLSVPDANRIVEALIDTRFIDDSRFARAYARDKMEYSRWGRRKIAMGLYQKRIDRATIAEALDGLDAERYNTILETLLQAKRRTVTEPDSYEGRTRLFRFTVSRGFEPELVSHCLNRLKKG